MKQVDLISFVVPTTKRTAFLKECLASIQSEAEGLEYEILVVYGDLDEKLKAELEKENKIKLIGEDPGGGATAAFDKGFRQAEGNYIAWLNDDSVYSKGAVRKMLNMMESEPEIGLGAFYFNGNDANHLFEKPRLAYVYDIPYANFGMIRKEVLKEVGYCDLRFEKYGWDPDLGLKVWEAGYKVKGCSEAQVHHYCPEDEVKTQGKKTAEEDNAYLYEKWKEKESDLNALVDHRSEDVQSYLSLFSTKKRAHYFAKKIEAFLKKKDFQKIDTVLEDLFLESPYLGFYYQAKVNVQKGNQDEAKKSYERAFSEASSDLQKGRVCFQQALLFLEQKEQDKYIESLKQCLRFIPEHQNAKAALDNLSEIMLNS